MGALGGAAGDLGGGLGCWGDVADEDGMAAAGGGSADDDGGEGSSCLESDNWRSRPISVLTFCLPLPALAVPGEWRGPTRECASPQAIRRGISVVACRVSARATVSRYLHSREHVSGAWFSLALSSSVPQRASWSPHSSSFRRPRRNGVSHGARAGAVRGGGDGWG